MTLAWISGLGKFFRIRPSNGGECFKIQPLVNYFQQLTFESTYLVMEKRSHAGLKISDIIWRGGAVYTENSQRSHTQDKTSNKLQAVTKETQSPQTLSCTPRKVQEYNKLYSETKDTTTFAGHAHSLDSCVSELQRGRVNFDNRS